MGKGETKSSSLTIISGERAGECERQEESVCGIRLPRLWEGMRLRVQVEGTVLGDGEGL